MKGPDQAPDLQAQDDKLSLTIENEQSRLNLLRTRHQELIIGAQACGPDATANEIRNEIDRIVAEERELSTMLAADQQQEAELRRRLSVHPDNKPELRN